MSGFYLAAELLLGLGITAQMAAELEIKRQINKLLEDHKPEFDLIQSLYKLVQSTFNTTPLSNQFKQLNLVSAKVYASIAQNMNQTLEQSKVIFQRYSKIRQNQQQITWKDYTLVSVFPVFVTGLFVDYMIQQAKVKFQGFTSPKQELGISLKLGLRKQQLIEGKYSVADMDIQLKQQQKKLRQNPEDFTFKQLRGDGWAYFKSNKLKVIGKAIMTGLRITMFVFGAISFVKGIGSLKDLTELQHNLEKQLGLGGKIQQDEMAMIQIISMLVNDASNLLIEGYNLIQEFQHCYEMLLVLTPSLHQRIQADADNMKPQNYVDGFNIQYIEQISNMSFDLYSRYLKTKTEFDKVSSGSIFDVIKLAAMKRIMILDNLEYLKSSISKIQGSYPDVVKKFTLRLQKDSIFLSYSLDTYLTKMNYYKIFINQLFTAFQSRERYLKKRLDQKKQRVAALQEIDPIIVQQQILPSYIRNYINPQYPADKQLSTLINSFDGDEVLKELENRDKYYKQNIARYVASFSNQFYYDDPKGKTLYNIPIDHPTGPTKQELMNSYKQKFFPGVIPIPQNLFKQQDPNAETKGTMLSVNQFLNILYKIDKRYDPNNEDRLFNILSTFRCNRISQTEGPEVMISIVGKNGEITKEKKKINIFLYQRCLIIQAENKDQIKKWEQKEKDRDQKDSPFPRPLPSAFLLTDKGTQGISKWLIQQKQQQSAPNVKSNIEKSSSFPPVAVKTETVENSVLLQDEKSQSSISTRPVEKEESEWKA